MGVAWYRTWRGIRRRRASFFGFAVAAGLVAAAVLAGLAGARRTQHAFDDMVERSRAPDIVVFAESDLVEEVGRRLDAVPQVTIHAAIATALVAIASPDEPGRWIGELAFSAVDEHAYVDIERALLLRGRRADPAAPRELVLDEGYADARGLDVGSTVQLGLTPPDQFDAAGNGFPIELASAPEEYVVVGVVRKPADLAPPLVGVDGTIDDVGLTSPYLTAAFWAEHGEEVASYGTGVVARLAGEGAIEAVQAALADLPVQVQEDAGNASENLPAIYRAVDVESRSLAGASALLGTIGLVLFGQAQRARAALRGSRAPGDGT